MRQRLGLPRAGLAEAALAAGGFLWYASLAPKVGVDICDEGYVLYIAQELLEGRKLYSDIELFNYLPGLLFAFAGLLRAAAGDIATLHLWLALPLALNLWLAFLIVRHHAGSLAGFAAGLTVLAYPGPWDRFYIPLLNLAILWCASQFLATGQARWLGWLGALAGVGLGVRVDAGACALAVLFGCALCGPLAVAGGARVRWLGAGALGFSAVLAVVLAGFAAAGVLDGYLGQMFGLGPKIAGRAAAGVNMAPVPKELWWRHVFAWQYYLFALVPALPAGMLAVSWRKGGREWRVWLLLLVWLAFSLPQFLIEFPDVGHLSHRFFAPLVVALISARGLSALAVTAASATRRGLAAAAASVGVCAVGFIFATLCIRTPNSFLQAWVPSQRVCLPQGRCFPVGANNAYLAKAVPLLEMVGGDRMPGEVVGVLPYAPGLAFLLKMPMPGRQSYLMPHSLRRPGAEQEYLRALLGSHARHVLLEARYETYENPPASLDAFIPQVYRTLRECFAVAAEGGPWQLLRRKQTPCPPP